MNRQNVIAIFDVGKTNKKLFLFDEQYKIVFEKTVELEETKDEDGYPCENVESLRSFITDSFLEVSGRDEFDIKAINFAAYGASFVHIDEKGNAVTPLYNYLKPYPEELKKVFYDSYGGELKIARETASPVLGSLNSGMQLYRIKHEQPQKYEQIAFALHLPQYVSYVLTNYPASEITSIGCHTNLWDFKKNSYHFWVVNEGIQKKFASILEPSLTFPRKFAGKEMEVGIGLHDSSAALIPYLISFNEPFLLISTGTWCISLNPFNNSPLTDDELANDCLCYLQFNGKPVKAARLFAGHFHDEQTKRIADHFNVDVVKYKQLPFDDEIAGRLLKHNGQISLTTCAFEKRELSSFANDAEAYHQLIADLVAQQFASTTQVLGDGKMKRIFVDGGFSKNEIYMNLLCSVFPTMEVCATSMAQATAMGAALVVRGSWNPGTIPSDMIALKRYFSSPKLAL